MGEVSVKQEPPDFSWTNIRGIDHNLPPLKNEMEPFVGKLINIIVKIFLNG